MTEVEVLQLLGKYDKSGSRLVVSFLLGLCHFLVSAIRLPFGQFEMKWWLSEFILCCWFDYRNYCWETGLFGSNGPSQFGYAFG